MPGASPIGKLRQLLMTEKMVKGPSQSMEEKMTVRGGWGEGSELIQTQLAADLAHA